MNREIVNHRWACENCSSVVGEDYKVCPICNDVKSIKDVDYSKLVKDVCASCEQVFNNSYLNYQKSGNYCLRCLSVINYNIKNPSEMIKNFRDRIHNLFKLKVE